MSDFSVADKVARFAFKFKFEDLSNEVIEKAKKVLLDTLGVALAAWPSSPCKMVRSVVEKLGGNAESTIIGSGKKVSCLNAVLANGMMVRYLDFNDCNVTGGHPSETIPTSLAVGEREHSTGKDIITNIVLSFELCQRWEYALPTRVHSGWHHSMRSSFTAPVAAGKLLGLDENQIANAIAISIIGHGPGLGIADSEDVEYTNLKSIMLPLAERDGILAALLAQKGFTGNKNRLFEHPRGWELVRRAWTEKPFDTQKLYEPIEERFPILQTRHKYFAAEAGLQPILFALMRLIKEHDIVPEDVKTVTVWTHRDTLNHLFNPAKRYPKNKETADHSAPFVIAVAIKDQTVGPDQYTPEKLRDVTIRELISKVKVIELPELEGPWIGEAIVEIKTKTGQKYKARDHWRRMPDKTLEAKFRLCTSRLMTAERIEEVIKMCYNLENIEDVRTLMKLLVL